jgi:Ser/Thr protein kinase RdoA (MazF antagonist)
MVSSDDLRLTREIAAAILGAKTEEVTDVRFLRPENHSWRVVAAGSAYYVKAHTKDWYSDTPASSFPVRHEVTGYRLLREAGLPSADVVGYSTSTDNPLGWPYLITRELEGAPLADLLHTLSPREAEAALRAAGAYLAEMHSLTYEEPGYLIDGPPNPPRPNQWLHWLSRLERFLLHFFENMTEDAASVDLDTRDAAASLLERALPRLREAYRPLRFVHGDCHANVFFLAGEGRRWRVSGILDMENCSAGAPVFDLTKFALEMGANYGSRLRWWEPLFQAYGAEPDFDVFRMVMVGHAHINFVCGEPIWPGTRADILRHLLAARTWAEMFDTDQIAAGS